MRSFRVNLGTMWQLFTTVCLFIACSNNALGQQVCPSVNFGEPGDALVSCNPNGTASVTLQAKFNNPTDQFVCATIECGPGGIPGPSGLVCVGPGTPSVSLSEQVCTYDTPSAPEPFVKLTNLDGNELEECSPVSLAIEPLSVCIDACPTIESLSIDIPSCQDVDVDAGLWPVGVDAVINNKANANGIYQWNFGDGSAPVVIPADAPDAPQTTHNYECPNTGDYHITLTVFGCAVEEFYTTSKTETINLPACGCPSIDDIAHEIGQCSASFNASITTVCSDAITEFIWNFGDGNTATSLPADPGDPTQIEHTYDANGTYTVTLTLGGVGSGCSSSKDIEIANCRGNNGDDGGGFDLLCFLLGLVWAALLAAYLIGIATGTLTGATLSAATAVIAAYSAFYIALCGICLWALWTFAGLGLYFATILTLLLTGVALPGLTASIIVAVGFLLGAVAAFGIAGCNL